MDRSQGLKRDKSNGSGSGDDANDESLSTPFKKDFSSVSVLKKTLSEVVAAQKPDIVKAKGDASSLETVKKSRRKRKWKKPRDKPNRPLSAYNLFFARERALMLGDDAPTPEQEALKKRVHCKTHGKIGFAVMARTIGAKWKTLEPQQKKVFEDMAKKEKERYQVELTAWKNAQRIKSAETDSNAAQAASSVSIPMDTSAMFAGRMAFGNPFQQIETMHSVNMQQSDSMRFLLESRRNLSQFQAPSQSEYIRNMQELPVDQAALLGMSQRQMMMDVLPQGHPARLQQQLQQQGQEQDQQYPSAAEASANTLLNQFQPSFPGSSPQQQMQQMQHQSQQQNLMDQQLFQEFAAMRRMQQRFMAGGYGMGGMGGMNAMNSMNVSMGSSGMIPFGMNNAMNMSGNGGGMPGMNNNMSMRGGGMNMNNFGNGL